MVCSWSERGFSTHHRAGQVCRRTMVEFWWNLANTHHCFWSTAASFYCKNEEIFHAL